MLWIKRNLFLAIGGLLALVLLAGGLFYLFKSSGANSDLDRQLDETKHSLEELYKKDPFPSLTNVTKVKQDTAQLQAALSQAKKFFTPVSAAKVTGLAFRTYRDNTLAELQRLAEQNRVTLPSRDYSFSFSIVKNKVDFGEGTFPAVPEQMAEVRALCQILFDAHIDPLVSVKRARVSQDDRDAGANISDYVGIPVTTNEQAQAVFSPYEITFHGLSSELAAVLEGLNKSPYGFLVKAVHVEPIPEAPAGPGFVPPVGGPNNPPLPNQPQLQPRPRRGEGPGFQGVPPLRTPGNVPVPSARPAPADRPVTLLKERRLRITLLVYAIRTAK
jgi:hypothetical protein